MSKLKSFTLLVFFSGLMLVPATQASAAGELSIKTVSSRPDMSTGGNSLVQVDVPSSADPDKLHIQQGATDVTSRFTPTDGNDHKLRALLSSLGPVGAVTANLPDFSQARLQIVDHSVNGPILSGIRQTPFYCQTVGPPLNADDCSVNTTLSYRYKLASGGGFQTAASSSDIPATGLLATVTTAPTGSSSTVHTVPALIRVETGTINRANYRIGFLVDPANLTVPSATAWNGRLVYQFGGGCTGGFTQGAIGGQNNYLPIEQITSGYAGAASSQNAFGVRCSDAVSAETVSMVKEHFSETWRPPDFTIGLGGSGGAMAQQMIDNNFPGLLDGSVISNSFPDNAFAGNNLLDCRLVNEFLASPDAAGWTDEQKRAVKGMHRETACAVVYAAFGENFFDPGGSCPASMPAGVAFDATTNPTGVRCTVMDGNVNVYGIDPDTGIVRRPVDNVGIQYGLKEVRDGTISVKQFLDLNEGVGGIDAYDGQSVPERSAATPEAIKRAYESGLMNTAGAGLASTPIIDNRQHEIENEDNPHQTVHALSMRARLIQANGDPDGDGSAGTQVIWTSPNGLNNDQPILTMDRWITGIKADTGDKSQRQKVLDNRPGATVGSPAAKDACFSNSQGTLIAQETITDDSGICGSTYPSYSGTRFEAGMPLANDIIKCQLKPVDLSEYGTPLTVNQTARINSIFPNGTCDPAAPGVGFEISRKSWRVLPGSTTPETNAPDTSIAVGPRRLGQSSRVDFEFTSSKTGGTYQCRFDSASFTACETPFRKDGMKVGAHTFEVKATDIYGNTDASPAKTYFVVGHPKAVVKILVKRSKVNRRGLIQLKTKCSVTGMTVCAGKVQVRVRGKVLGKKRRKARRLYTVGSAGYKVKPGVRYLKVHIKGHAKKVLKRRHKLNSNLKVTANRTGANPLGFNRSVKLTMRR